MGQVTYITGSAEDERKLMGTVDALLTAGIDIEAKILPKHCSGSDLREAILGSHADIFIVGSPQIATLSCCVAVCTCRPVIGVLLEDENENNEAEASFQSHLYKDVLAIATFTNNPVAIMKEEDLQTATSIAIDLVARKTANRAVS